MTMTPGLRRLLLTAHIVATVGWLGAVGVFLALAVIGLTSSDAQTVRGAYLVMEPAAWYVLVPFAFASLVTGVAQSLASVWGLFKHYWVLFKLLITAVATLVLLTYMQTFASLSDAASQPQAGLDVMRNPSPALHATLAFVALLTAAVLSVYKPRGLTPFGLSKQRRS